MDVVEVEVDDVESVGFASDQLHEPDVVWERLPTTGLLPESPGAARDQTGRRPRVTAGEQGDLMALADQLLGQVRDDTLRPAV